MFQISALLHSEAFANLTPIPLSFHHPNQVVHKYNTAARRLHIRGHNGKIYPFLIVNDADMTESRREDRVMQLVRMLNHYLSKQKVKF